MCNAYLSIDASDIHMKAFANTYEYLIQYENHFFILNIYIWKTLFSIKANDWWDSLFLKEIKSIFLL